MSEGQGQGLKQKLANLGLQVPQVVVDKLVRICAVHGPDTTPDVAVADLAEEEWMLADAEKWDRLAKMCDADEPAHMSWKQRRDMFNEVEAEQLKADAEAWSARRRRK